MNDTLIEHAAPQHGRGMTRDRLLVITLLIVTGAILGACALLLAPFLTGLTWALSLAVIAYPVHGWIKERVRNPQLAAFLAVAAITVGLVVPVVFLSVQIGRELADGLGRLQSMMESNALQEALDKRPALAKTVSWVQSRFELQNAGPEILNGIRSRAGRFLRGSIASLVQLGVALFCLFFFFRDREQVLGTLRSLTPLSEQEVDEVFGRVKAMIRAALYGNVTTSLLQGTLGGLIFWILGLPAPLLWGAAMFLVSLIPSLGSFLIWAPTAAILAATGNWTSAIILTVWGLLVVSSIDNIVYPFLVGRDMRMHTMVVFLSLLGGVFVFGPAGIVLGPVIFATALALIDILRRRTAHGDSAEVPTSNG